MFRKIAKFIISLAIPLLAGFIGGRFTMAGVESWYQTLQKPFFTPPSSWFAPIWTVLYVLMGISFYLIWQKKKENPQLVQTAMIWFFIQLALNILWSMVFFYLQSPFFALIIIILLVLAIIQTMRAFSLVCKTAAWLLLPYLIWTLLATALNVSIWWLNR